MFQFQKAFSYPIDLISEHVFSMSDVLKVYETTN